MSKKQATFDNVVWYDITDIKTEEVKTRRKGVLTFTRFYFGTAHAPAYDYETKGVREVEE